MNKFRAFKGILTFNFLLLLIVFVHLNVSSVFASPLETNSIDQVVPGSPPLIVEKELSTNIVKTGETVTVKITLKNLNTRTVYDVTLTERLLSPFAFDYKGLSSPTLTFNSIKGNEVRTIYYIISMKVQQEGDFLFDPTVVTYYFEDNVESREQYTSYSQELKIKFSEDTTEVITDVELFNYYFVAIILILYISIIVLQSIFARFVKRK
ncbi:MAG: hypothetical protein ACW967_05035 [Candidatus Hodarchaeales archaeon]|jgi:hypothetical protein